jgi:phosphoesterase RecJ-like protein
VLDTASRSQLGELAEPIATRADKTVILDHHATADDLAECIWRDTTAAATGLMVFEAIGRLGWPLPDRAARALATAIYTDTGWLRFSNTDARTCRAIAELIEAGVAPDELYQHIFQTDRPQRLALLQRVLASLELHCDDQLAVMTITWEDFAETGARPDETENLINEALRLGCVEVAVILVQNPPRLADTPEPLRVSLRSRSRVDVSQIASALGGGGHARAAGLKSTAPLGELKAQLIGAIGQAL